MNKSDAQVRFNKDCNHVSAANFGILLGAGDASVGAILTTSEALVDPMRPQQVEKSPAVDSVIGAIIKRHLD